MDKSAEALAQDEREIQAEKERAERFREALTRFVLIAYQCNPNGGPGGTLWRTLEHEIEVELQRLGLETRSDHRQRQRRPTISGTTRTMIFERDMYRCLACGTHCDLTLDHVVPLSEGGSKKADNLQTLCTSCNSSKGTRSIDYRRNAAKGARSWPASG